MQLKNIARIFIVAVFFVSLLLFVGRKESDVARVSDDVKVGQNFIVGVNSLRLDPDTAEFLTRVKPGGIILYKQAHIQNKIQLRTLINDLQKHSLETTGVPYFIFLDEEPGGATRLGLFKEALTNGQIDWNKIEEDVQVLKDVGVNVNLAPISDFSSESKSYLSERSVSQDSADLIKFNDKFISVLNKYGIGATLKHFPGLGDSQGDPHKSVTYIEQSADRLEKNLEIFKEGIASGAGLVMTNHAMYGGVDDANSVTFSKKIIDILRNNLGFKGIVITDDVTSMPLQYEGIETKEDIASRAILAGHTMVMFSWDNKLAEKEWKDVLGQYKNDKEFAEIIDSNYRIISKYKDGHMPVESGLQE